MTQRQLFRRLLTGLLLLNLGWWSQVGAAELTALRSKHLEFAIGGVEWDGPRQAVYLSDQSGQRVVKVSCTTGLEVAALELPRKPEAIRLSPDGTRLYVATLTREHDPGWFENQEGFLHILDPDSFTQLDEFKLQVDPYSLAPTDDGRVAIGSGSGQWTRLDTYDVHSHALLGSESGVIYMVHQLALHPSQNWLYLGENGFLFRFDPDPVTRHFRRLPDQFPSAEGGGGGVFVFPEGDRLIDGQAYVYALANEATNDFRRLRRLEVDGVAHVAFNPENLTCFVLGGNRRLHQFHAQTLAPGSVSELPAQTLSLQATRDELLALVVSPADASLIAYRNPAQGAAANAAPQATFSLAPAQPATFRPVAFDAGLSTDDGPAADLRFRWDWNGDGDWDTAATNRSVATHWFHEAGVYAVTLEVSDAFGAVTTFARTIEVPLAPSPGEPLGGQPAFQLPFPAAAMWVDARRGHAYFTDPVSNRLVRVVLRTVTPDREWRLQFPADALAATADGNRLYFSQLAIPRSDFNFDRQAGYIGLLDLTTGELVRELPTAIDPASLLAIGEDRLLVGGGSAQMSALQLLDVASGHVLSRTDIRANSTLLARTSDRVLIHYGSTVDQVRITAPGELVRENGANVLDNLAQPLAQSPDGTAILAGNGYLLHVPTEATLPVTLRQRLPNTPGEASGPVTFDLGPRKAAFWARGNRLDWLETGDWTRLGTFSLAAPARFIGLWSERIIVAGDGDGGTLIQSLTNPALGAETNSPPVARLAVTAGPTFTDSLLDATATTDAASPLGELLFRWDWEGDGSFDTAFATNAAAVHRYFVAGTFQPQVQVRDRFGATAVASVTLQITARPDPGMAGETNTPHRLGFAAVDVAFDRMGRRAYASTGPSGLVVSLDLDTGLEARRWSFPWPTERMSVRPDGSRLYVALPAGPHEFASEPPAGRVAEFDLATQTLVRVIPLRNDPWDLAATDDGYLFVSPGSNQFAPLDAYRIANGVVLTDRTTTRFRTRLHLAPEQTIVWVGTTEGPQHQFFPATFHRPTATFSVGTTASGAGEGSRIVLPLSGNRLLDSDGRILLGIPPVTVLSPGLGSGLRFDDAAVIGGGRWVAAANGAGVRYLNLASGAGLPWVGSPAGESLVADLGPDHGIATVLAQETRFLLRREPATNASQNLPPVITWAAGVPGAVAIPGSLELVVQADDPDGQIETLEVWDGVAKLGSMSPAFPRFTVHVSTASTNEFRVVARDNLGGSGESPVLRVVGSLPPARPHFTQPAIPAVLPGAECVVSVTATDPDGEISRVEYFLGEGAERRLFGVVTNAPWSVVVAPITVDSVVTAVAYDEHGLASFPASFLLHPIGAEGDDLFAPFPAKGPVVADQRSNVAATRQAGEPFTTGTGRSLWWRWTAPSNGIVSVTTLGSSVDTILGVYVGTIVPASLAQLWTTIGTNNDAPGAAPAARLKLAVTAGTAYLILVDSVYPEGGAVRLNLAYESVLPDTPANDLFANRILITALTAEYSVNTAGATREVLEPTLPGAAGGKSVWWEWVAPATGTALVTTAGSGIDTVLSVAASSTPSPTLGFGTFTASHDDVSPADRSSRLVVNMTAGRRYLFAVDSFDGVGGPVRFNFAFTSATNTSRPANDDFAMAFPITGDAFSVRASTRNATLQPLEPFVPGGGPSVWWSWTAPHDAQAFLSTEGGNVSATVWTGLIVSNLTAVPLRPAGNLAGRAAFIAQHGTTYRFRLAAAGGDYFFNLNATLPLVSFGSIEWIREPANATGIRFNGPAAVQGTLQSSSNLLDWATVLSRTWIPGEPPQPLPPAEDGEHLFYRLLVEP